MKTPRREPRFAIAPALAFVSATDDREPLRVLTELMGVDKRRGYALARGGVTARMADRIAVALSRMPWDIWPDWHHSDPFPEDEPGDRFCGRRLNEPMGKPHTCAAEACCRHR